MNDTTQLPVPVPTAQSEPFWQAARQSKLIIPECRACGFRWMPITCNCPNCGADDYAWVETRGTGTVFSFTVMHQVYHPGFTDRIPYIVAVIELNEGPRLLSNLVGIAPDTATCGMAVQVTFERRGDFNLPQFEPVRR